jgi:hypothetical protein
MSSVQPLGFLELPWLFVFIIETKWVAILFWLALAVYFFKFRRDIIAESGKRFFTILRWSVMGFAGFMVLRAAILSVLQYWIWQKASPGFLPPHQPLDYFLGYSWLHFGKEPILSILFAAFLIALMMMGNRFSGSRFFYREEPWLAGFGILGAPWPAGMLVMGLVLAAGVLLQVVAVAVGLARRPVAQGLARRPVALGRQERLALLWFWLPAALIAIIFGDIIGEWIGLNQLRI